MATVTLNRSDLFPVGTSVGIYPGNSRPQAKDGPPTSAVIASGTVDAAGALSVTNAGILSYQTYQAYALVNGEHRFARLRHVGPRRARAKAPSGPRRSLTAPGAQVRSRSRR
jgi:hypothetical protein